MNVKEKLIQNGFIKDSHEFSKYNKYLDAIFGAIVEYGYIDKPVPEQKDNPNIGRIDTEEFCVFKVKDEEKAKFEKIMQDLNIFLSKENVKEGNSRHEWFCFKSKNFPELKAIVRGCVKLKNQEVEKAMNTMAKGIDR